MSANYIYSNCNNYFIQHFKRNNMIQIKTTKSVEEIIELNPPKFFKKENGTSNYEVLGILENDRAIRFSIIGNYSSITNGSHKDMHHFLNYMLDGTEIEYEEFRELLLLVTLHIQHQF